MPRPSPATWLKELAEECHRQGLRVHFYYSLIDWWREDAPRGRTAAAHGTAGPTEMQTPYFDFMKAQLTELLTGYGEIFCVWFDNACGEGPAGKKQVYDFPRYFDLIRKYQPNAVIFNDYGPDVRWCGNEAGHCRHAEWSVIPSELCHFSEVQTGAGPMAQDGELGWLYNTEQELGTIANILYSKGLTFTPTEINMSIRPGWFWHEKEDPHSLERLFDTYLGSVGANACMHLNLPPNTDGLMDERDVKCLKEFGELLKKEFGSPVPAKVEKEAGSFATQPVYTVTLEHPVSGIRYVELREDISKGQRIESFRITAESGSGSQYPLYQGTTVATGRSASCRILCRPESAHQRHGGRNLPHSHPGDGGAR